MKDYKKVLAVMGTLDELTRCGFLKGIEENLTPSELALYDQIKACPKKKLKPALVREILDCTNICDKADLDALSHTVSTFFNDKEGRFSAFVFGD